MIQPDLFSDEPTSPPAPLTTNAYFDEAGHFIHDKCATCGADAPFGVDYVPRQGKLGMWYCRKHWPQDQDHNTTFVDEEREETRFRAAIAQSAAAVEAVARYLRAKGFETEVVAQAAFVDRAIFKDAGADLRYRIAADGSWKYVEVKARTFEFDSRKSFPYTSVIIDRATKGVILDLYFNVSQSLRYSAVVSRDSQPHWTTKTIHDHTKGYNSTNYECPKDRAYFVALP
jgi:hypothetical protein